jgi:hypothetical protein
MLTPRQRQRQRNAARTPLNAPDLSRHVVKEEPRCVVPLAYQDPELPAIGFNRQRSLWWQVERVEVVDGLRTHVLIAQVRSEETALRLVGSQKWQTIARKWRCRTHSNWAEPRVIS